MRINKFIAASGYCSRRKADEYIEQCRVTVNGADCNDFSMEVSGVDRVQVDGETIKAAKKRVYIVLHKPSGITCTTDQSDPTNVVDFVGHKERIFPVGRLDKDSEGLIFLTSDGDIVNKILRAGNAHQKEYVVTTERPFSDEFLEQLSRGVKLDTGERTLPCTIKREGADIFRIILVQGLNRQIRRMCEARGMYVKKLVRVRIMTITLRGIERGKWRYFTQNEIEMVESLTENSANQSVPVPKPAPKPRSKPKKVVPLPIKSKNKKNGNNSRH